MRRVLLHLVQRRCKGDITLKNQIAKNSIIYVRRVTNVVHIYR